MSNSALSRAGVTLGIGTDSAASNTDLDLLSEARAVREIGKTVTARRLLRMLMSDGAKALGLDDDFGTLEHGKQADIAVFRTGPTAEPERDLVRHGGRDTLEAVCAAGIWRVREGRPCFPVGPIERAGARARAVAEQAMDGA